MYPHCSTLHLIRLIPDLQTDQTHFKLPSTMQKTVFYKVIHGILSVETLQKKHYHTPETKNPNHTIHPGAKT